MIKAYMKFRKAVLGFALAVLIFFPLVYFLHFLDMAPIFYSLLVFFFLFGVWVVLDFFRFRQKRNRLAELLAQPSDYCHDLPEAADCLEETYQQLVTSLCQRIQVQTAGLNRDHGLQVEYYTRWLHQIKTPIAAIRLAMAVEEADQAILTQELFKIEQYVEMALDYVKMQDLSTDLLLESYDIADLVHQSVKKYASLFIYKKLAVEIAEIRLVVPTDRKWLSFIVEQVLSNAIKYTPAGSIKISAGDHCLMIADSGIGIRAEDLERVFEKGYTGYNGRLDQRASGIGLYMAKQVAAALAIKIGISSTVGMGTTVTLEFPHQMTAAGTASGQ